MARALQPLYWTAGGALIIALLWVRWSLPVNQLAVTSVVRMAPAVPAVPVATQSTASQSCPVAAPSNPSLEGGPDDPDYLEHYLRRKAAFFEDGTLRGVRVYPGSDEQVFDDAGLVAGDLVIAVDGERLNDPARASEVLDRIGSAANARLTVERDGIWSEFILRPAQGGRTELP
jgi:type II secretion system protein C